MDETDGGGVDDTGGESGDNEVSCTLDENSFVYVSYNGTTVSSEKGDVFINDNEGNTLITGSAIIDGKERTATIEDSIWATLSAHFNPVAWLMEAVTGTETINSPDAFNIVGEAMQNAGVTCTNKDGEVVTPPIITELDVDKMKNGGVITK